MARKGKTAAQRVKLAELLAKDTPVCDALLESGYAPNQAAKGWTAVPDVVLAMLPKHGRKLAELGKIDKDTRKHLIRGRLIDNIVRGKDGGAMSAKVLGAESELNMWIPDSQVGVIVLNAPQNAADRKQELLDA